jgi:hypothetical protein
MGDVVGTDHTPLVTMDRTALLARLARLSDLISVEHLRATAAGHDPARLSDDGLRLLIAAVERYVKSRC